MFFTDRALWLGRKRLPGVVGLLIITSAGAFAGPALGQSCPDAHSACDNGGCCPSSDQCCPTLAEGCCSSSTPYCCGDGTCAASPGQCGGPSGAGCEGYDIPCGEGCAPAGADCCDDEGHYCPPESMCGEGSTCLTGEDPTAALLVTPPPARVVSEQRASSPVADPANASGRSCSLPAGVWTSRARASEGRGLGIYLLGAVVWLRRRRHTRLAAPGKRG